MKTGGTPSIGSQVIGELKGVAQDLGKGIADIPKQIIEGSNKQSVGNQESPTDHEGKALEAGQQIGDDSQVKQQGSGQGFGDALKSQLGIKPSQQIAQKKLAQVRRNLEREIKIEHQKKEQQEAQKKQTEEQREEYTKKQKTEQKRISKQSRIMQMLSMGKGERRGTKGK